MILDYEVLLVSSFARFRDGAKNVKCVTMSILARVLKLVELVRETKGKVSDLNMQLHNMRS
jgi:transcriptional regulator of met regulon